MEISEFTTVNETRNKEWNADKEKVSVLFHATEFAGEVGEAMEVIRLMLMSYELGEKSGQLLNLVKKIDRERIGIVGSRTDIGQVRREIADIFICLDKLSTALGINLEDAVVEKFNETSVKYGLRTQIAKRAVEKAHEGRDEMEWVETQKDVHVLRDANGRYCGRVLAYPLYKRFISIGVDDRGIGYRKLSLASAKRAVEKAHEQNTKGEPT